MEHFIEENSQWHLVMDLIAADGSHYGGLGWGSATMSLIQSFSQEKDVFLVRVVVG